MYKSILGVILCVAVMVFILVGCSSNMKDSSPRDIELLIGGYVNTSTLFRLNENTLSVILFSNAWALPLPSARQGVDVFDESMLEDFIDRFPMVTPLSKYPHTPAGSFRRVLDSVTLELSPQQLASIWNRIDEVITDNNDSEFQWVEHILGHNYYVWAIVDEISFWSFYERDFNAGDRDWRRTMELYINRELLLLAYELIDLSPIPVGNEHNPLRTPNS